MNVIFPKGRLVLLSGSYVRELANQSATNTNQFDDLNAQLRDVSTFCTRIPPRLNTQYGHDSIKPFAQGSVERKVPHYKAVRN